MYIEIKFNPESQWYSYTMWDGPDGIDHSHGDAKSLGELFEMIIQQRAYTAVSYTRDT